MTIRLFVVYSFLFAGALSAQTAEQYASSVTAEHWISMCRPLLDAQVNADGTLTVRTDTDTDQFDAGQCSGALDTIGVLLALVDNGKPVLGVCQPLKHSLIQWVNIFTDYAKRHPKRYQEPFAFVMLAALQEAYPCTPK